MVKERYIEIVKSSIDICRVFEDLCPGTSLSNAGPARKKCRCVFHEEKTPSLVLDTALNRFKCFGCGKGGDVITLVRELKGIGFGEAVRFLLGQYCHDVDLSDIEEAPSPEERQQQKVREELFRCNELAYAYFRERYEADDEDARRCRAYAERSDSSPAGRWPSEYCKTIGLGYCPKDGHSFLDHAVKCGMSVDLLLELGLVGKSEKGGSARFYDTYCGRLVIPQRDLYGRIVTFTARALNKTAGAAAKYINGRDCPIYTKRGSIFGIDVAMRAVRKTGKVFLVEGAPDVMRLQSLGIGNVVASLGGSWSREQLAVFRSQQCTVCFIPDSDVPKPGERFGRGEQFVFSNGRLALEMGFRVTVREIPAGDDGKRDADSYITSTDVWESMTESDFIVWYAGKHIVQDESEEERTKAVSDTCDLLALVGDDVLRTTLLSSLKKKHREVGVWRAALADAGRRLQTSRREKAISCSEGLEGFSFFQRDFHYYDLDPQGREREWTNFVLRPLFLIADDSSPTRIFELENESRVVKTVELKQADVTALDRFKVQIEGKGNFRFFEKPDKFELLKAYLYEKSEEAQRVPRMGWNMFGDTGFYSFCNGVVHEGRWKAVDEYGIIRLGGGTFYLPAMSKIHMSNRSAYVNERRFLHDPSSSVDMREYFSLLLELYGGNGVIAVCFYLATLFRDIIVESTRSFPLLNIYGKKGTGKTEFAISLLSLFQRNPEVSNLESTSYFAMGEKCAEVSDMMVHFDEYKNSLSAKHIDFLKGIYDNAGRSKRSTDGERRESTSVDCGVVLTGQELPTADVALFSRVIFLESQKSERTREETDRFHRLLALRNQGPTSITAELVGYRSEFKARWRASWERALRDFKRNVNYNVVGERFINNWSMMLAVYYALEGVIGDSLPFDAQRVKDLCYSGINYQFSLCSSSDEVSMFWSMFAKARQLGEIREGQDYKIMNVQSVKVTQRNVPVRTVDFGKGKDLLFVRERICMAKASIQAKREGKMMLSDDSLSSYLTSLAEYVGKTHSPLKFYIYDEAGNPLRKPNDKGDMELLYNQERVMVFDYEGVCSSYDIDLRTFKESASGNKTD